MSDRDIQPDRCPECHSHALQPVYSAQRFDEHGTALPRRVRRKRRAGRDVIGCLNTGIAFVYALVSSDAPEAHRYIGSTSDPSARFTSHLSDRARPKVQAWVQSVRDSGNVVEMLRLWEGVGRAEAFKVERKMISAAVARGLCDLNTAWIAQGDAA